MYQSIFKSIDPFHSKSIYYYNPGNIILTQFSLLIKGKDKKSLEKIKMLLKQRLKELTLNNN